MRRHPTLRRVLVRSLLVLLCLPIVLPGLALTALAIPMTRRPIVGLALAMTNESLDGMRIEVDDVARLDLWGVDVRGVRVFDDKKRELVSVRRAALRIAPFGLVRLNLHLTDVGVTGVRVHLYPSEPEPEVEEPSSEPASFQIVADQLHVSDTTLDMQLEGRALHAVLEQLSARGAYGPRTWVALQKADLHGDVNGQRAVTLRSTRGTWDEKKGGEARLVGDLLDGRLLATAAVPPIDANTRWPIRRATLNIDGLSSAGLARIGLADAAKLHVPVSLHTSAVSDGETLTGGAELLLGEDKLQLAGRATASRYEADVHLAPTQLSAVSGLLPSVRVGAALHAELQHAVTPMLATLEWSNVELDGRQVPQGALAAQLALPVVKLDKLSFAGFEQALRLSGQYDTESGAARVNLDTSELELSRFGGLVPAGMQGTLNGGLEARLNGQALSGQSDLSMRYFRLGTTRADNASLGLTLSGSIREPRGELKLAAHQIVASGTRLRRVALNARAGTLDLQGDLSVEGVDRFVSLELTGKREPGGAIQLDAHGTGRIADKRVGITVLELRVASGAYSVRELSAYSGNERLSVSGSFDAQQRLDASLSIVNLELAPWARLFLENELTGRLDLSARARGTIERPYLSSQIALYGVHSERAPRAPAVDVRSSLLLDTDKHRAELTLNAQSPDRRVVATVTAKAKLFKRATSLPDKLARASLELDLEAHSDVPFVTQFEPSLSSLDGRLDARLHAQGTMDEAKLELKLLGQLTPVEERAAGRRDKLQLEVRLAPEQLTASVSASDRFGKLLDVQGKVKLPAGGPRALIADSKQLLHAPATLGLVLAQRRLDQLEGSFGMLARQYRAALPVRVGANLSAESDGQALSGKLAVKAHAWGKGLDDACGEGAEADVTIDASLAEDRGRVVVKALPSGGGQAELTVDSRLAVDALLDGAALVWGPAELRGQGRELNLHTFPMLCMLPPSRAQFQLSADDLGKGPTRAKLSVDIDDVPAGDGPKLGLHLEAFTTPTSASADGQIKMGGANKGSFSAKVPLLYGDSQLPTLPLDQPIAAHIKLPTFPVAAVASFTDAIGRAGGHLEIDLKAGGTVNTLQPSGYVSLHDAAFSLASIAQPFAGVNGRFEVTRDKLVIRDLKARDRDGKLAVTGYARYDRQRGGEAEVYLSAERFPLRQQGSIVGELSTRAKLDGKIDQAQKLTLGLAIAEGRIWLTGKGGQQVQELAEHPDIRFDTEAPGQRESEVEQELKSGPTLALLRIETKKELWVMHEDFSVQVGVELRLTTDEGGATLQGEVALVRGELSLLGKPFRIEKGAIHFTGDVPPDPELDIKARYATRKGEVLIVQVVGRGSAPQIIFSGAANNAGDAAMLLSGMGGSGAEGKAKSDAASFAAGVTAGLLAVSARRKFGDWVPMLAIENNASGAPSGARAGFDASKLIPKPLRGFARGVYVEGVVGSRNESQAGGVGVGVRVEVALPQDFVTSMGYGPGTVWSTDVYWSP